MSIDNRNDSNSLTGIGTTFRYAKPVRECFGAGPDTAYYGIVEELDGDARVERDFVVQENGILRVVERFFVGGKPAGKRWKTYYLDSNGRVEATGENVAEFARGYHLDDPQADVEHCYEQD